MQSYCTSTQKRLRSDEKSQCSSTGIEFHIRPMTKTNSYRHSRAFYLTRAGARARKQTPAPFQPASAPAKLCRGHTQAGGRECGRGRQSPAPFLCGGSCRPRPPLMPLPSFCLRKPPPNFVGGNRRQRARAVVGAGSRLPLYFAGAHAARAPLLNPLDPPRPTISGRDGPRGERSNIICRLARGWPSRRFYENRKRWFGSGVSSVY